MGANSPLDLRFGSPSELDLAAAGHFIDLHEVFVLPDATDPTRWIDGKLLWVDNARRFMIQGGQFVASQPLINPAVVEPAKLQTLDDLLRPEFKGKIAFADPTTPGSGQTAVAYLASIKGIDFVKTLFAQQEVVFSRDVRQLTEWVSRGLHPIAYGADTSEARNLRRNGLGLQSAILKDAPGSLSGGCTVVSIPKGAPHPNAAAVFVNWYLSRAGQEAYVRGGQTPSRRLDISQADLFPETIPVPGTAYLDQYREDWYTKVRPALQAELRKLLDK